MPKMTPSKVRSSASYERKQTVRSELQALVSRKILSGDLTNQEELDTFLDGLQFALEALRGMPFESHQKTSTRLK